MHSVPQARVFIPYEPSHVKTEREEAGPQQIPQGRQVGDGEVVRVQAPSPHHTDDEVG